MTVTALALVAVSFVSTRASASAGVTDLILGFTASGGTGVNTNLEIDLGPASNFTTTTSTINLTQLAGADLTSVYGSGWDTRTDLTWGVAGITDNVNVTYDVTNRLANPRVAGDLSAPYGLMSSLPGGFNNGTVLSNANAVSVGDNTTNALSTPNSYSNQLTNGDTNFSKDWVFYNLNATQINSATAGPDGTLELYGYYQSGKIAGSYPLATDLGTFSLSGSGSSATLTFTGISAAAVPEPSSYALGLCGLFLLWVLKRRKSIA